MTLETRIPANIEDLAQIVRRADGRLVLPPSLWISGVIQVSSSPSFAFYDEEISRAPIALMGIYHMHDRSEAWFMESRHTPARLLALTRRMRVLVALEQSRSGKPIETLVARGNIQGQRLARLCGFALDGAANADQDRWIFIAGGENGKHCTRH